jgi:hypothetical protein
MIEQNQVLSLAKRFSRRPRDFFRVAGAGREAHALLISYPKSGRTWLRFILASYFSSAYGLDVKVDLHNLFTILPNFDYDPLRGLPAFKKMKWPPSLPMIPVSHLLYDPISFRSKRFIFMIRDPRDVMVSAYFHETRHKHRFEGTLSEFLVDKTRGIAALVKYLNVWARVLEKREHFVVSYERLSLETVDAVKDILHFLECPLDYLKLNAAIASAKFESMRELEVTQGIPGHSYDLTDSNSLRMRRGKPFGYADHLSPQDIRVIDDYCVVYLNPSARRILNLK